uniref:F-box domain-containing protein n=1 Tax=Globodera rostochiensis TaxID=31243 RepID=A0A914HU26_GLORO
MSEHPREAQPHLKKISVADDVWFGVFPFLGHAELGLKLALISERFDRLVDAHLGRMKWKMSSDQLYICRTTIYGAGAIKFKRFDGVRTAVELPLAQTPPLKGIIGFNKITIGYIDHAVINFVRHLANFDITLQLKISPTEQRSWHIFAHEIWPFLSKKLNKILLNENKIVLLQQHFGATVLRDCANLRFIECSGVLPEFSADGSSPGQALAEWLRTPREDGLPKHFCANCNESTKFKMVYLKKAFSTATTPVNFIVHLPVECFVGGAEFELVNEQTRERLTMRRLNSCCLLKRLPLGLDAKRWMAWHWEAVIYHINKNHIVVSVADQNIDADHFPPLEQPTKTNE